MAIQYNENIKIAAPNPLDWRYLSNRTLNGSQLPYSGITEVNNKIIPSERYTGLTVNINGTEYWYKDGIGNNDLVEKIVDGTGLLSGYITGATNYGYYEGLSNIQTLEIVIIGIFSHLSGDYDSTYPNFYIDNLGNLQIGIPSDGNGRRAYLLKNSIYEASFVWSDYEVIGSYKIGWNLVDVDVSKYIEKSVKTRIKNYYGLLNEPYNEITWNPSAGDYNNGSSLIISSVQGNLNDLGSEIKIGNPIYSRTKDNSLYLRTIKTTTPNIINISHDAAYIDISGTTICGINIGKANEIYSGLDGNNLKFRTIQGSGNTTVKTSGDRIIVYSSSDGSSSNYVECGNNIGLYIGKSGTQRLYLDYSDDYKFAGYYDSLYNNYYINSNGVLCVGKINIGGVDVGRRGFIHETSGGSMKYTSFVWSNYESPLANCYTMGWILLSGHLDCFIGCNVLSKLQSYYESSIPYTEVYWSPYSFYNNGSELSIEVISGSTMTGNTICVGGPIYSYVDNQTMYLRTINSKTPENLKVSFDGAFVYLSAITSVSNVSTCGIGESIVYNYNGKNLNLKSIVGSGGTHVKTCDDCLIICSDSGGGSGFYELSSPAAITLGGICQGDVLTGKTSNEILEMLLVPTLYPTITSPSSSFTLSESGLKEIGCLISCMSATSNFNRGSILPIYCGGPSHSVGFPISHNLQGTCLNTIICSDLCVKVDICDYEVQQGIQCWSGSISYNAPSSPPLDSRGNPMSACPSGTTSIKASCINGVYPLYATTSNINVLTKQPLVSMSSNYVCINLVSEVGGKQKFEIPCAWLSSNELDGISTFNTTNNSWEYESGSKQGALTFWTESSETETIQGQTVDYRRYEYNGSDRSSISIRLEF